MTINRKKCVIGVKEVSFFGHWVSEVRSYMGLVNFIGEYIPGFSTVVAPISDMLSKSAGFMWGAKQEAAF